MPRILRKAVVIGATANVAAKRGAEKANAANAAAAEAAPAEAAPVAEPATAAPLNYAALASLKELLDSGALTQAEFDSEKAKLLSA